MALLEKYADRIKDQESSVETITVKVNEIFPYKTGTNSDGERWTRVGIKTDKGVFFAFDRAISGIKVDSFIPDSGYTAKLSIRERSYKDKEGKDAVVLDVVSCKVITVNEEEAGKMVAMASAGIVVRLF